MIFRVNSASCVSRKLIFDIEQTMYVSAAAPHRPIRHVKPESHTNRIEETFIGKTRLIRPGITRQL